MIKIAIVESDPFTRQAIQTLLAGQKSLDGCCVIAPQAAKDFPAQAIFWIGPGGKEAGIAERHCFAKPLRIGALLDRVRNFSAAEKNKKHGKDFIQIGSYALDRSNNDLRHLKTQDIIRLTEKEAHILEFLARDPGKIIDRRALLDEVWGYAENVETHTLETHIYRLRQKIEKDPAAPVLLLTQEQGYSLKV